jgi:hypothetical protein
MMGAGVVVLSQLNIQSRTWTTTPALRATPPIQKGQSHFNVMYVVALDQFRILRFAGGTS